MTKIRTLALTILLSVGLLLGTMTPAQAAGYRVAYLTGSAACCGTSSVLVGSGGAYSTLYPGYTTTGATSMKLRPGQWVKWRYTTSSYQHTWANTGTSGYIYGTVTADTYILGSSYY